MSAAPAMVREGDASRKVITAIPPLEFPLVKDGRVRAEPALSVSDQIIKTAVIASAEIVATLFRLEAERQAGVSDSEKAVRNEFALMLEKKLRDPKFIDSMSATIRGLLLAATSSPPTQRWR